MLQHRKPILFVAGVAGGVMLATSAALACTTFKGTMKVTAGAGRGVHL